MEVAPVRQLESRSDSISPITFDHWPFRLNVSTGFQDILLIIATCLCVGVCVIPFFLSGLTHLKWARQSSRWIYKHYNIWFWLVALSWWAILGFTLLICPDWTMTQYLAHLGDFFWWWAKTFPKLITSGVYCVFLLLCFNYGKKVMEKFDIDMGEFFRWPSLFTKEFVPIELTIWKVEGLASGGIKSNDIYVEVGLGDNQVQSTRVQHNVGARAMIKQNMQLNFSHQSNSPLTVSVCDQQLVNGKEVGRCELSAQDVVDLCQNTSGNWQYHETFFLDFGLKPSGRIWLRLEYVHDEQVAAFETQVRESGFFGEARAPAAPNLEEGVGYPMQSMQAGGEIYE